MANITILVLIGTNEFITIKVFLRLFTICTRFEDLTSFSDPNRRHFLDWLVDVANITIFVLVGTNKFITIKIDFWLFTIGARFKNLAFFSHPNRRHFLDWFFNLAVDVSGVTVFILVGANKFITVKVFLRLFTVGARLQDFTFLRHPDSSYFLDWFFNLAVDVSCITVFVLIRTDEFITVEVFLRMFTICTRFEDLTFFSDPDSGYFLGWFFNRTIDVRCIAIFVLIRTNEFITIKVFLRMLTICTRFEDLTFFSDPDSGYFLGWFFNRTIDVRCIAIFVLIRTNEFITIKVFLRMLTISTRFKNLAFFSDPDSSYFLGWFFNRTVNVSGDGTIHFCFHKLITWEGVFRFEVWSNNWGF